MTRRSSSANQYAFVAPVAEPSPRYLRLLRRTLAILSWLAAFAPLCDARAGTVTLEGAIRDVLRSDNIAVRLQNESVNGAAAKVQQASGTFDWNVNAQGGWQILYAAKSANGVLLDQIALAGTYYYTVNVGREFRNGISIAPGFTAFPGASASAAQTGGLTQARPSLGLKIPLLRGFGSDAVDAPERAAKDTLAGVRLSRGFALGQLVLNVTQTYWRCMADDEVAQISGVAEKNGAAYEQTFQKMAQKGLVEPTTAKQWVANDVSRHLNAQKARDAAQICHRDLAYAITGSISGPVQIPSDALPEVTQWSQAVAQLDTAAFVDVALETRPDLQAAQKNVEAAAEALRGAHDSTYPQLDVHIDPDRALLTYSQSLQNNIGNGQEAAAAAANNQAQLTLLQLRDQIRADVTESVRALQRAASDWSTLNAAVQQLEDVVAQNKKRAQFGSINWAEFLAAQDQLLELKQELIGAQLQFANDMVTLRLATGMIDADTETPANLAVKMASVPAVSGHRP